MYKLSVKNVALFLLFNLGLTSFAYAEKVQINSAAVMLQDVIAKTSKKEFIGKKTMVLLDLDDFLGTYQDFPEALYNIHYATAKKQDKCAYSQSLFSDDAKKRIAQDLAEITEQELGNVKNDREFVFWLFTALRYMSPEFTVLDLETITMLEKLEEMGIEFRILTSRAEDLQRKLTELNLTDAGLISLIPIDNVIFCGLQSKVEVAESRFSDYDLIFFGDDSKKHVENFENAPNSNGKYFLYWLNSESGKLGKIKSNIFDKWKVNDIDTTDALLDLYEKVKTNYLAI
ncbi:MAG: hypothetical protein AB8G05_26805 [Oligoflexales bacterium]